MTFKSGRHFLQIPGPTNVPKQVLRALSRPTIDHRGPEFAELSLDVLEGLQRIFQTSRVKRCFILMIIRGVNQGSMKRALRG